MENLRGRMGIGGVDRQGWCAVDINRIILLMPRHVYTSPRIDDLLGFKNFLHC